MDSELRQQMIHSKIEPNIKKEKWEQRPSIFTLGEVAEENGEYTSTMVKPRGAEVVVLGAQKWHLKCLERS